MSAATVLAYHAVGDVPPEEDPHNLWVSTERFHDQIQFLVRRRRVVPLAEIVAGQHLASRRAVALTFDDAYRCIVTNALPILEEHGLPATIFVPTAYIGDRNRWDPPTSAPLDILDERELVDLVAAGLELESHGHRHLDLSSAGYDDAWSDLRSSADRLEDVLGRRPRYLAYPFLRGSVEAGRAASDLGFEAAFNIDLPEAGPFHRARVGVSPLDGSLLFAAKTSGRYLEVRHSPLASSLYGAVRPVVRRILTRAAGVDHRRST